MPTSSLPINYSFPSSWCQWCLPQPAISTFWKGQQDFFVLSCLPFKGKNGWLETGASGGALLPPQGGWVSGLECHLASKALWGWMKSWLRTLIYVSHSRSSNICNVIVFHAIKERDGGICVEEGETAYPSSLIVKSVYAYKGSVCLVKSATLAPRQNRRLLISLDWTHYVKRFFSG